MVAEHLKNNLFQEKQTESPSLPPVEPPAPTVPVAAQEPEPAPRQAPAFLAAEAAAGPSVHASGAAAVALQEDTGEAGTNLYDPEPMRKDPEVLSPPADPYLHDTAGNELTGLSAEQGGASLREGAEISLTSFPSQNAAEPGLSHEQTLNIPPLGMEGSEQNVPLSTEAAAQAEAVPEVDVGGQTDPNRWVDPSVIRFPPDAASSPAPSPSASFTVRLEGPQGEQEQEIQLPVRIRRESTGEEICFRLSIRIDPCDPEG